MSPAPVASGAQDAERVERWARGLCVADGVDPDKPTITRDGLCWTAYRARARAAIALADAERGEPSLDAFALGDRVRKVKGSSWHGRVVGFYSTALTPVGYAVESEREPGSVQIYPESALEAVLPIGGEAALSRHIARAEAGREER